MELKGQFVKTSTVCVCTINVNVCTIGLGSSDFTGIAPQNSRKWKLDSGASYSVGSDDPVVLVCWTDCSTVNNSKESRCR